MGNPCLSVIPQKEGLSPLHGVATCTRNIGSNKDDKPRSPLKSRSLRQSAYSRKRAREHAPAPAGEDDGRVTQISGPALLPIYYFDCKRGVEGSRRGRAQTPKPSRLGPCPLGE